MRVTAAVREQIRLATHTSTTDDRAVAAQFADGGGVIIEFEDGRGYSAAADVSWISKFPSEREWLRRGDQSFTTYTVVSSEIVDGQQRVVLEGR